MVAAEIDDQLDRAEQRVANLETERVSIAAAYESARSAFEAAAGELARNHQAIDEARRAARDMQVYRSRLVARPTLDVDDVRGILNPAKRSAVGTIVIEGTRISGVSIPDGELLANFVLAGGADARGFVSDLVAKLPIDQGFGVSGIPT